MSFHTPLRYPGGKARLGPWLALLMRHNRISGGTYVEPYAGGAGAAIYLLANGYVHDIVINDLDPCVHAFWWSVLNDSEGLVRLIRETPVTVEQWHLQRSVVEKGTDAGHLALGFACFFLNRTNRSGILSGGLIGGQQQKGSYSLAARFNKDDLVRRIERIASRSSRIKLFNADAVELIRELKPNLPLRSLIYLDPPYFVKGYQLYRNHYGPDDHAEIAREVLSLRTPWLVTYDMAEPIRALYASAQSCEFSLSYSTHLARPTASEQMFFGGGLELPTAPKLSRTASGYPSEWEKSAAVAVV